MNRQEICLKKSYFNKKVKAQSSIEFSIALILAVLFMVFSSNLFVWLNHNIVQRQRGYENTRISSTNNNTPGRLDFYPRPATMNLFSPGGYR